MKVIISPNRELQPEDFDKYVKPIVELIISNGHVLVFTMAEMPDWFIAICAPTTDTKVLNNENELLLGILPTLNKTLFIKEISVIGRNLVDNLISTSLNKVSYYVNIDNFKYRQFFN